MPQTSKGFTVDDSELKALGLEWKSNANSLKPQLRQTLSKGSKNIKDALNDDIKKSRSGSIARIRNTYDIYERSGQLVSEIGPRKGYKPNHLANLAYFGSIYGGGTHLFYERADKEAPTLVQYVGRIAGKAIGG